MKYSDNTYDIDIEKINTSLYKVEVLYQDNYYIYWLFFLSCPIFYDVKKQRIYDYDDFEVNSFLFPLLYLINEENFGYKIKSITDIINECRDKCSFIDFIESKIPSGIEIEIKDDDRNYITEYFENLYL